MKLTLSVPLIWMLFSSAGALKCVQDGHSSDPLPCNSDEQCATIAVQRYSNRQRGDNTTSRACASSCLCNETSQLFSLSFFDMRMASSLHCCSTDGCNSKDIPFPEKQEPNDLQCFSYYPESGPTNETLQCVGIEDRCIVVNMTENAVTHQLLGCASANLCEGPTEMKLRSLSYQSIHEDGLKFSAPKCCETSLCNSASD